jgi:hypothetical protein
MALVVECLPGNEDAFSSVCDTAKQNKTTLRTSVRASKELQGRTIARPWLHLGLLSSALWVLSTVSQGGKWRWLAAGDMRAWYSAGWKSLKPHCGGGRLMEYGESRH